MKGKSIYLLLFTDQESQRLNQREQQELPFFLLGVTCSWPSFLPLHLRTKSSMVSQAESLLPS